MNTKKQIILTASLILSMLMFTVGLVNMNSNTDRVTKPLTLPMPEKTVSAPKPAGNVIEPAFVWVEPVAEPAGL